MLSIERSRPIATTGCPFVPNEDRQWLDFNRMLSGDAAALPNEAAIQRRLEQLLAMEIGDPRLFWLSLARIAELALNQAGDYADSCEFLAAGDLLVNPRRIDIHRRGWADPVVKRRHGALSTQFAAAIGDSNPVSWLSQETCPRVRTEALLPFLENRLAASGMLHPDYLADLHRRMCKVADAIAFLMAWQIQDSTDLAQRRRDAAADEAAFIDAGLCGFDRRHFDAIGADIEAVIFQDHPSIYLATRQ